MYIVTNPDGHTVITSDGDTVIWPGGNDFTGNLVLPNLETLSRRTGVLTHGIILQNWDSSDFSNARLQAFFDTRISPHSDAPGSGPYDPVNALTGGNLHSGFRTITVREPELNNRLLEIIEPEIHIAMSGKVRSYVKSPVFFKLTFTWVILPCDEESLNTLIGILAMEQIRYVHNDTTWRLVLTDKEETVTRESRSRTTITLNFLGEEI